MAKKNKFETSETTELKNTVNFAKKNGKQSKKEQFAELYKENQDLNRSKVAELLDVSRMSINRWIEEMQKK